MTSPDTKTDLLHWDFETHAAVDIKKTGGHKYAKDRNTDVWLACYAFNDDPVQTWWPGQPLPDRVRKHVENGGLFYGHNVGFEWAIWNHICVGRYGFPSLLIEQCRDTAAYAAAMALPRSLDGAAKALGLSIEKDAKGKALMQRMAKPRKFGLGPYRVLVCGGRDFDDKSGLFYVLDDINSKYGVSHIIHGAATGADSFAADWAKSHRPAYPGSVGVIELAYATDWTTHGKAAGPIHNAHMLKYGAPDIVVATPGGRGTGNMIAIAEKAGIPVLHTETYEPETFEFPEVPVWWVEESRLKRLEEYCKQDVEVERALDHRLRPLSPSEQKVWELDHTINRRGIQIDVKAVRGAMKVVEQVKKRLDFKMAKVTGGAVKACSEVSKLTAWLQAQGVDSTSVAKADLEAMLSSDLPDKAREALEIRKEAAKSSTAKLTAMLNRVEDDGRARDTILYHGAGTGRFCLAEGSPVWTKDPDTGHERLSPIQMVKASDLVFDGREWVPHEGVVYSGVKLVWQHDSVWATAKHKVFVDDNESVPLYAAKLLGLPIWTGAGFNKFTIEHLANDSLFPRISKTYDIINAGPRNRFSVNGKIVSNSGRGIQTQNLPRPWMKQDDIERVIELFDGDYVDLIELIYGPPLSVLSSSLRGLITAGPGMELISADFSAIEARGLAALAGQQDMLDIFRETDAGVGVDIYSRAASGIFLRPVDRKKNKDDADAGLAGKVSTLSLGYQGGIGAAGTMARNYGLDFAIVYPVLWPTTTHEEREKAERAYEHYVTRVQDPMGREAGLAADVIKQRWRADNQNIVKYWYDLEEASVQAVLNPGATTTAGHEHFAVKYKMDGAFLWCRLPSGRVLCYPFPQVKISLTPWGKEKYSLTAMVENSTTKKWERRNLYGGLISENITQAVCRDLLVEAILRAEAAGYPVVMHVHDELVCEVPKGYGDLEEFEKLLGETPNWARGLPIKAEGWRGLRYRK